MEGAEPPPHVGLEWSEDEECGRGEARDPPLAAKNGGTVCREKDAAGTRDLIARKGRWESGVDGERMPDKDSVASVEAGYVEAGDGGEGAAGSVSELPGMTSDSRVSAANSSKAFSAQSGRSPSRIG
jgi:hypothetical protein